MTRTLPLITILAVFFSASFARAQAPSSEELHRLVDEKKYPQALQKITAALALKGQAARFVNRYDLFMLKGECHLQLKQVSNAADAFTSAAKEPTAAPPDRAVAAAHAMLLRRSRGLAYTPKPTPAKPGVADRPRPAPIDILDKESRKRAFAALLADELAANEGALANAKTARALGAIATVFKPLAVMEGLELAATGDAAQVHALQATLADQAKRAVADALRDISKRVGEIDKEANTFVETWQDKQNPFAYYPRPVREKVYKKKGLTDPQTRDLQEANVTCDKLPLALTELAAGLNTPEKSFDPFTEEAARIRREVDRILDTDFQRVYRQIPKK